MDSSVEVGPRGPPSQLLELLQRFVAVLLLAPPSVSGPFLIVAGPQELVSPFVGLHRPVGEGGREGG